MASIIMMFAALTSAYIVRKAAGNWYEFKLPVQFFISTICLLISSFFIERSYRGLKSGTPQTYKTGILLSCIFGIAFLVFQVVAWKALVAQGITLDLNVSGSFLYAMSGLHALHVAGGIAALIVSALVAFSFPFEMSTNRIFKLDLVRQYWHFVDLVWIYLLIFLILQ
ncbi:MAG: cytochrome c oxidase subunit 3 [Saprospiraceae bacterium]|nr:cytochrome c oxidase subunit 3 [Saprospiraceae bacterium]